MVLDQIGHPAHLNARDTSFAVVSRAPIAKIEAYRARMGWKFPWYSSYESTFNPDFGVGPAQPSRTRTRTARSFGLSVFVRDGGDSIAATSRTGAASRRSGRSGRCST